MNFSFKISKQDTRSKARAGVIKTPHGEIKTPAFSPVATKASVKTLSPEDIKAAGSQVVLGNTYHLFLRPGLETIKMFGGFGPFMGWDGPTITDSGGYQVSFLWQKTKGLKDLNDESWGKLIKITDEGAVFSSYLDGTKQLLSPEKSIEIQKVLGADIIMAFDQPLGSAYSARKKKEAFERTLKWEERSYKHWKKITSEQALFGIVQGDLDVKLRRESLAFILTMGFPGIAMGGESIGKDPLVTARTLDTVSDLLPKDKPVHALGLGGGPEGIFEAISRGVDIFDNTGVTRMARTGLLFLYPDDGGNKKNKFRCDIKNKRYKSVQKPISKKCSCYACQNFSSAYLHHLQVSGEILGLRLATIHNVTYINSVMSLIRESIIKANFISLKSAWL